MKKLTPRQKTFLAELKRWEDWHSANYKEYKLSFNDKGIILRGGQHRTAQALVRMGLVETIGDECRTIAFLKH